jgi:streptogramin lyase
MRSFAAKELSAWVKGASSGAKARLLRGCFMSELKLRPPKNRSLSVGSKIAGFVALVAISLLPVSFAATITGTVKGPDGSPFQGAFVEARNSSTRIMTAVLSHQDGTYEVPNLAAGEYQLMIRATGYKAEPQNGVNLTANQRVQHDFSLAKGNVSWSDLSTWQAKTLLPDGPGKELIFGGPNRAGGPCFACHNFQSRMAPRRLDKDGWLNLVNFMRNDAVPYFIGPYGANPFNDQMADQAASYLTQVFGPDTTNPKSPADLPGYAKTVRPFSNDAMNIVYVIYSVPNKYWLPFQVYPPTDGSIWVADYGNANLVERINPETGKVDDYKVPCTHASGTHAVEPGPDGMVYFAEQGCNRVGQINPKTGEVKEFDAGYPVGKEWGIRSGSKHDSHPMMVDGKLYVFSSGAPASRLDPATGKFTNIEGIPDSYDVIEDKKAGTLWFTDIGANGTLREVDPRSLRIIMNFAPSNDPSNFRSHRIGFDSKDMVWVTCRGNTICQIDPETKTEKEFVPAGPEKADYAIAADENDHIWYSMSDLDEIQRLDPKSGAIVEYPFPYSEITMRRFWLYKGHMWWASPANGVVGYFYLAPKAGSVGLTR